MIFRKLPSSVCEDVKKRLAERGDPPPGPHPSRLIDDLVKSHLAPILKSAGFRKSGHNFWRDATDWIDVLNIQKSQWNDAWQASFYINLGVYWKEYNRYRGVTYKTKFPHEYDCTVFSRIFEPEKKSWTLQPDSDLNQIGGVLNNAVQLVAFKWFDEMHSYKGTLGHLQAQGIADNFERWLTLGSKS